MVELCTDKQGIRSRIRQGDGLRVRYLIDDREGCALEEHLSGADRGEVQDVVHEAEYDVPRVDNPLHALPFDPKPLGERIHHLGGQRQNAQKRSLDFCARRRRKVELGHAREKMASYTRGCWVTSPEVGQKLGLDGATGGRRDFRVRPPRCTVQDERGSANGQKSEPAANKFGTRRKL